MGAARSRSAEHGYPYQQGQYLRGNRLMQAGVSRHILQAGRLLPENDQALRRTWRALSY